MGIQKFKFLKTTTNFHHNKNDNINFLGNILKNHNRYLDNNKWEITVNNNGNEVISDIYSNSKFNSEDKSKIFFILVKDYFLDKSISKSQKKRILTKGNISKINIKSKRKNNSDKQKNKILKSK